MTVDLFGEPIEEKPLPKRKGEVVSEVAPGQFASHLEVWELPQYVLSKLVANGDGTYRLEAVDEWFGYVSWQDIRKKLGIKGLSDTTIRRLCIAGFLEHVQPTPQCYLVKIDSLVAHLERTRNTRSRATNWWTDQRRQLWRTTCGF